MADGATSRWQRIDQGIGEHSELVSGVVIGGLASFGVWFLVTGGEAESGAVGLGASVTGVVAALIVFAYAHRRAKAAHHWVPLLVIAMTVASLMLYTFVWQPDHAAVHAVVWIASVIGLLVTTHWAERQVSAPRSPVAQDRPASPGLLEEFFVEEEPAESGASSSTHPGTPGPVGSTSAAQSPDPGSPAPDPTDADDPTVVIAAPTEGPPPPEKP